VKQSLKKLNFRFELGWLKHPDFLTKVDEIWKKPCHADSAFDRLQMKIKKFKQYFKAWGFNNQGVNKRQKMQIREELLALEQLEEDQMLSYNQTLRKIQIKTQLLSMSEEEELYWLQRSHEKWLHEGDNNTGYFHRIANGRRRKNSILHFEDDGEKIEGDENLLQHATSYYKELFGLGNGNAFPLDADLWGEGEKVTEEDNHLLTLPFYEEEIKKALFQMEHNKAAGPDAIPIEFYQKCWNIVKKDILEMFNDFHDGRLDDSRLNYGVITLLPKVKDAEKIQQFRPICLLNCI
jgi:mannosylglycoprotein endo-beta-mannosidase